MSARKKFTSSRYTRPALLAALIAVLFFGASQQMVFAAFWRASSEVEDGTLSGTASKVADITASDSNAVLFNGAPTPPPPPPLNTPDRNVILYQQQRIPAEYIASHISEVDALPFEGIIFRIPSMDSLRPGNIVSVEQFKAELAPMKAAQAQLRKVRQNFVTFRLLKPSPFDTYTTVMATNMANLAEAARDAGIAGIVYDNEDYANDTWVASFACPGDTLDVCQTKARNSGKTVMEAVIAKWPTVRFMTTLGPFFGHQPTFTAILGIQPEPKHYVLGAYTIGLNEATIGTQATYIDGGEVYSVNTDQRAQYVYTLRKTTMPQQSSLIPSSIKTAWSNKISLAFALYDKARTADAAHWQNDLTVNAKVADDFTWGWSEAYSWVGPPEGGRTAVPAAFIEATKNAREAAGLPRMPLSN